ncbi:MAG: hypothetical protein ABIK09_08485 [Pseudomonadota bacterium]
MPRKSITPVACIFLLLLCATSCVEEITLQTCANDDDCPTLTICRSGRCFHEVPPWVVPPCSSPAREGRCCDLDPPVIPIGDPDCRLHLLTGSDALSAPAGTPTGEIVVAAREGSALSVIAVEPDGDEAWRETLAGLSTGDLPVIRVDGDGRVYADRSASLWTRSPTGVVSSLDAGGTIDGGYAVCRGGVSVALVRGPDGRGLVRLDQAPGTWPLAGSLDRTPVLPPALSLPSEAIAVAWSDGTVTVHDLETGVQRGLQQVIALEPAITDADPDPVITSLALDRTGHLWVSTSKGILERLSTSGDITADFLRFDLGSPAFTPPVLPGNGAAVIGLADGRIVRGSDLFSSTPETLLTLVTAAPGSLSLLDGDGYLLLGDCPDGRCLSIFFGAPSSSFGAAFDLEGEHRHSGLPGDAAVGLPGPEGLATLVGGNRLDGLVVAGSTRDAPWPGPDGGPGNGRCAENAE